MSRKPADSTAAPADVATGQVSRMLALVPYISRRPGIAIAELAREFGVPADQIVADLNVLMMCGEPGYFPDDLIDVVIDDEDGTVSIGYDAGLAQPIRLTAEELTTLTSALRVLADQPGLIDSDAVHSALRKMEAASGGAPVGVAVAAADPGPALAVVREAIESHRRVRMTYYTASRDDATDRDVDPIRLLILDGYSYLEGYCYRAESIRMFRLDRIDRIELLDTPAQAPLWTDAAVPDRLFTPGADASTVTVRLAGSAAWIAEYYAVELVQDRAADGGLVGRLTGADDEWLVRLLLSLGGAVTILDRPDLARQVRERASTALAAYGVMTAEDGGAADGVRATGERQ